MPHVAPACLPRAHATFTGSRCWVTGWGQVGTRGYTRAGQEISRKCLQDLRTKHLRSFVDPSLAEQVVSIILICRTPSTLRASCRPPCRRWTCPWWRPRSASGRSAARDWAVGRGAYSVTAWRASQTTCDTWRLSPSISWLAAQVLAAPRLAVCGGRGRQGRVLGWRGRAPGLPRPRPGHAPAPHGAGRPRQLGRGLRAGGRARRLHQHRHLRRLDPGDDQHPVRSGWQGWKLSLITHIACKLGACKHVNVWNIEFVFNYMV